MSAPVVASIVAASPAGLTAEVSGVLGRVPVFEIPELLRPFISQLAGQKIPVAVIGRNSPLIWSYKKGLAVQAPLPAGQVGLGTIRAIARKSLYVEVGNNICVISQAQSTPSRIATLSDLFHPEQVVPFSDGSIIAAQPSPWLNLSLLRGTTICGIVVDVLTKDTRPAVLVEIIPGVIGIADMPPSTQLRRRDKVIGKILHFNQARKRVRIAITSANGRTVPSLAAAGLIGLLEAFGPLPVAAAELIYPDALELARRARGAIAVRDLGGELGFWPTATAQVGLSPANRQQAFGWFVARALEANCRLECTATGWVFTSPKSRQANVAVLPDLPPPAGGMAIVPQGVEPSPRGLCISVKELQVYDLEEIITQKNNNRGSV